MKTITGLGDLRISVNGGASEIQFGARDSGDALWVLHDAQLTASDFNFA